MKYTIILRLFLLVLSGSFLYGKVQGQSTERIRMLEESLPGDLADTVRLKNLTGLATFYLDRKATYNMGKGYLEQALELARLKALPISWEMRWLHARVLNMSDMPMKAIDEMNVAISELEGEKMVQTAAEARNYVSLLLLNSGRSNESIANSQKNIAFARENGVMGVIPVAYQNIATVYGQMKKHNDQKINLELSLKTAMEEKNTHLTAQANFRLGNLVMYLDSNLTTSLPFLKSALNDWKSLHDSANIINTLNMIGWFCYVKHKPDSSLNCYQEAISWCSPQNIGGFAKPYENIGTIYRDKKDYDKALFYYDLCERYALKTRDYYVLSGLYKDMSDLFVARGDYQKAYEYRGEYQRYNDSLKANKYAAGLALARTKFDTESKDSEIQLLNLKLEQQKYMTIGFVGFIELFLLIGGLIYYQMRMAARRKISEMNTRLAEITHANLRQQMNPHFIFNTLNSIQYYMYQHDKIATNNYLTKFSLLIRKILENSQHTLIPIKDELEVIRLYLELESLRFKEKFRFDIDIEEEIDTLTCKIPTMLIQPYVENAVCHGLINKPGNGFLLVRMQVCNNYICCVVEDNGIGREAASEIKKQKDTPHSSLGIRITESRIQITNSLYGTNLSVSITDLKDSENKPCGTRVELQLPLMT